MKNQKLPILKFKNQNNNQKEDKVNHKKSPEKSNEKKELPILKFRNRKNNGKNVLYADCPEVEALLYLMRPRQFLEPTELHWVSKMGYKWEIAGDRREFKEEMIRLEASTLDG
jgi:hypothetical protein